MDGGAQGRLDRDARDRRRLSRDGAWADGQGGGGAAARGRAAHERRLHTELGFESFSRYVEERLDLPARTARRLVRLARSEADRPEVASAFRDARITLLQAELLLRGGSVERARRATLRRLEDELPLREVTFSAPREVAALFRTLVQTVGLERMLDHAIATWLEQGTQFTDYADFERDGFRCTVPACTARRNLQSHHIVYRSAGGADEPWNRTTLCAFHHHRGVHGHTLTIRGRAPDALLYRLAVGTFRSHDERLRLASRRAAPNRGPAAPPLPTPSIAARS